MSKFKTEKTLMYEYLLEELKDEITETTQRYEFLLSEKMMDEAKGEFNQLVKLTNNNVILSQLLKESKLTTTSHPKEVTISHIDKYKKNKNLITLKENVDESYFYKRSEITLNSWRHMEEGKVYIFHNLKLKREGEKLISQYPQETMWYEMSYEDDASRSIFDRYGTEWLYYYK